VHVDSVAAVNHLRADACHRPQRGRPAASARTDHQLGGVLGMRERQQRGRDVLVGQLMVAAAERLDEPALGGQHSATRPVTGWDSLTDTEQAVSRLVAQGLNNNQVAARMYISTHTVAHHLRQTFRKLHIASRVELARIVIEEGAVSS
jgi:DNA-binding NarL/FixJ family response regulator